MCARACRQSIAAAHRARDARSPTTTPHTRRPFRPHCCPKKNAATFGPREISHNIPTMLRFPTTCRPSVRQFGRPPRIIPFPRPSRVIYPRANKSFRCPEVGIRVLGRDYVGDFSCPRAQPPAQPRARLPLPSPARTRHGRVNPPDTDGIQLTLYGWSCGFVGSWWHWRRGDVIVDC